MKVKNLTGETLGWQGKQIGPGGDVEVDDATAALMVARNPQKFALVEPVGLAPDEPVRDVRDAPNRMQRGGRTR
jgi:hypothetical protein